MPETKASLLIADDDSFTRIVLSKLFTEEGYPVRSSVDSVSALTEIRRRVPEFLISDLNMSGTSGLELLAIIRSEFPEIRVIAMSNGPSGNDFSRCMADGYFHKRGGFGVLLRIVQSLPSPERLAQETHAASPPIWVTKHLRNSDGRSYVAIECPECGGSFPKVLKGAITLASQTNCLYCGGSIRYSVIQPDDQPLFAALLLPLQGRHATPTPALQSVQNSHSSEKKTAY
jgi:CheY-like chemotaxis protein